MVSERIVVYFIISKRGGHRHSDTFKNRTHIYPLLIYYLLMILESALYSALRLYECCPRHTIRGKCFRASDPCRYGRREFLFPLSLHTERAKPLHQDSP